LGRVSLTFWKKSGRAGSGQFTCCVFFRSLIDFDWIEGHLISGRVGSSRVRVGSDQFDFLKKLNQVGFMSGRVGQISRVRSGYATSKHHTIAECDSYLPAYLREMIILLNLLKIKFTFIVINVILFF
jgi:hypothetical protein